MKKDKRSVRDSVVRNKNILKFTSIHNITCLSCPNFGGVIKENENMIEIKCGNKEFTVENELIEAVLYKCATKECIVEMVKNAVDRF